MSAVYQARDTQSGESVCLKVYSKANLSPLSAHQVLREIRLHSQVQHTNVIQFYAAWEDAARYFIVTEFAKGVSFCDGYRCWPWLPMLRFPHCAQGRLCFKCVNVWGVAGRRFHGSAAQRG